jgi:hypothetical protein
MNRFLFCILMLVCIDFSTVALAEIKCSETIRDGGYRADLPTINKKEFIELDGPLFDSGDVKCHITVAFRTGKNNERTRSETGIYGKTKYRIYYSDGSGTIQGLPENNIDILHDKYGTNWSTSCHKDEMDDTYWCMLNKGNLHVGIEKSGDFFVQVGNQHYPGSISTIRVDKNSPIESGEKSSFNKTQTEQIIEALLKGQFVLTRYQKWPYQNNLDEKLELFGFAEAWHILNQIYKAGESS